MTVSLNWSRRDSRSPVSLEEAIPIAVRVALKGREMFGQRFIDGADGVVVERGMSALRLNGGDKDGVARVIENAIEACRVSVNPRWDGSVA